MKVLYQLWKTFGLVQKVVNFQGGSLMFYNRRWTVTIWRRDVDPVSFETESLRSVCKAVSDWAKTTLSAQYA